MSSKSVGNRLAGIAFLTLNACSASDIFSLGEDRTLAEMHPPPVEPATSEVRPVWSVNGAELGYVLADARTAVARPVASGQRRTVYAVASPATIVGLEPSADGSEWFTASSSGQPGMPGSTIRRHTASTTDLITDRGGNSLSSGPRGRVMLSGANGDLAYIVRPDSLFLLQRATGGRRLIGVGCSAVAALSPAGDEAICYPAGAFAQPLRFTLASTSGTVLTGSEQWARVLDVVWNGQGIFMLSEYTGRYIFERVPDSQSSYSTPFGENNRESSGSGLAALSADGRTFAYVNGYCAVIRPIAFCESHQVIVYRADGVAKKADRVAIHSAPTGMSLSLSPASRSVAYVLDGQLYILPGS